MAKGEIYGFYNEGDWACIGCLLKSNGTREHPLLTRNPAYQLYCKNWDRCASEHFYGEGVCKDGSWTRWECGRCALRNPPRAAFNNINIDGDRCKNYLDLEDPCPVTLEDFKYRPDIWAEPNENRRTIARKDFDWRCICPDERPLPFGARLCHGCQLTCDVPEARPVVHFPYTL